MRRCLSCDCQLGDALKFVQPGTLTGSISSPKATAWEIVMGPMIPQARMVPAVKLQEAFNPERAPAERKAGVNSVGDHLSRRRSLTSAAARLYTPNHQPQDSSVRALLIPMEYNHQNMCQSQMMPGQYDARVLKAREPMKLVPITVIFFRAARRSEGVVVAWRDWIVYAVAVGVGNTSFCCTK